MMNATNTTGVALTLTSEDVLALVRLIGAARDAHTSIEEDADHARHNQPADEAAAATDRANELRNAIAAAERALGLPPSDGWEGDRDVEGAPLRWENHYKCGCEKTWSYTWSSICPDICPRCFTECQPVRSGYLTCVAPTDQS